MFRKHEAVNGVLLRLIVIVGIGLLLAKAAVEDGGDPTKWALGLIVVGGITLVWGVVEAVLRSRSSRRRRRAGRK